MKKVIPFLITFSFFLFLHASSQTTVNLTQQIGNYCHFFTDGSSGYFNQGAYQVGLYANSSGAKQVVCWRNLTTDGTSCGTNLRSLQVGDQFVVTLSATRAYGRIGFALLAAPATTATWADRENNYALSVDLDGPKYLGGSNYGNWYIKYLSGSTSSASFGGLQNSFQNFTFAMTLVAADRMNIAITNNSTSTTSNFYDIQLNSTNPITDYSVFLEDDYDGSGSKNIYWGLGAANQQPTITDTHSVTIGQGNNSFTISSNITDGKAANLNTGSVSNILTKAGSGTITLTGQDGYTGLSTVNSGILELNRTGGTTIPATNSVTLSGGNLRIMSDQAINNSTLGSGSTVTIDPGTSLTINGTVSGSGTFTGSSTSNLTLGGAAGTLNFTSGSRALKDLVLGSGSASATLGTALDIYGNIQLNGGTLNMASQAVTLKSNSSSTASIDQLNAGGTNLTGADNVTMERFIPQRGGAANGGRAYRVVGSTVVTTTPIRLNWMEGVNNTSAGANINPNAGFGTQISGSQGNTNGFDVTQSNSPSLYTFTPGSNTTGNIGYPAVTSVNSGTMDGKTGYFLYIRGDRSTSMTEAYNPGGGMSTTATTLRCKGSVQKGDIQYTIDGTTGYFTLITNPYPAPIDWNAVSAGNSNIASSYTFWNPNNSTQGGFVTVPTGSVTNRYIQPGQAFFVQKAATGGTTVTISETMKAVGNNNNGVYHPQTPFTSFRTELFLTEANGIRHVADEALVKYDNSYSAGPDPDDAEEINNWQDNIAINRNGTHLAIEARPVIVSADTIPLFMNKMRQTNYEFVFTPSQFTNTGLRAELIDNFLGRRSLLSVTDPVTVGFAITAEPASYATDRFEVVFSSLNPLPIDAMTINVLAKNGSVEIDWGSKTETNMDHYEVERSADNSNFNRLNITGAVGNSNVPANYSWVDANPLQGDNFYRIRAMNKTGSVKYSSVVKLNIDRTHPDVTVTPNPLSGNALQLHLNNLEKGIFTIILYNNAGQEVYAGQMQHTGGSADKIINLGNKISPGTYRLLITGDNGFRKNRQVVTQ